MEKIDIREVIKPEYRDPSILEVYMEIGSESYSYSKGYMREYIVIVVRRITADQVRKSYYPFVDRDEALGLIAELKETEAIETIIEQYEEPIKEDNEGEKHSDEEPLKEEKKEKKSDWFDTPKDNVYLEMQRLLDKPMRVRETNVTKEKAPTTKKEKWRIY